VVQNDTLIVPPQILTKKLPPRILLFEIVLLSFFLLNETGSTAYLFNSEVQYRNKTGQSLFD